MPWSRQRSRRFLFHFCADTNAASVILDTARRILNNLKFSADEIPLNPLDRKVAQFLAEKIQRGIVRSEGGRVRPEITALLLLTGSVRMCITPTVKRELDKYLEQKRDIRHVFEALVAEDIIAIANSGACCKEQRLRQCLSEASRYISKNSDRNILAEFLALFEETTLNNTSPLNQITGIFVTDDKSDFSRDVVSIVTRCMTAFVIRTRYAKTEVENADIEEKLPVDIMTTTRLERYLRENIVPSLLARIGPRT